MKIESMFWNKEALKHQLPGKHYVVEKIVDPVLGSLPWVNNTIQIWRQITIAIDGKIYTMGCQRFTKYKNRDSGWYFGGSNEFSPEFNTIGELKSWLSDKVIKGTCGDGSGGYHIRVNQSPRKHEVWI
ncbi:hypothetical protein LCGC14_0580010 [marine sediment metagenome]|uniref:Uncharacterized protein n=1 Tax=marine sediment metagenome TaxID=412755 RepID=A0A0F9RLS9_9ZZZZ